jgi:Caspase domain/TIR domain
MEDPLLSVDQSSQALVVGVSRYLHLGKLRTTLDVPGVREVLTSLDYCAYPPERVTVLDEEDATRDNIIDALRATCERAGAPRSRTFVYFSGHGGQGTDGASYILPVDARKGQYHNTAISARQLSQHLDRCAGELTVVLDCCRAAGMSTPDTGAAASAAEEPSPGLTAFADSFRSEIHARGRVVFAASRADGKSFVSPEAPYGIFTGHMLDGLRGAASTNGGDVTVTQLFDYLQQRVVLSSGTAQRPSFIANTEAFYPLTRYPRPIPPSTIFEKDVYLSYDRGDPVTRDWVAKVLQPDLEGQGCSIWDYDDLGYNQFVVEEALVKSRYVVVLLTASYLKERFQEFTTTMAVLQAINTRTPRFVPILRELCNLPLWLQAFVGLDMTSRKTMEFRDMMRRLIKRLKKQPHER